MQKLMSVGIDGLNTMHSNLNGDDLLMPKAFQKFKKMKSANLEKNDTNGSTKSGMAKQRWK